MINNQMKRLYQSMDKIRQSQIHSLVQNNSSTENFPIENNNLILRVTE
jgi:hypothetical protein